MFCSFYLWGSDVVLCKFYFIVYVKFEINVINNRKKCIGFYYLFG